MMFLNNKRVVATLGFVVVVLSLATTMIPVVEAQLTTTAVGMDESPDPENDPTCPSIQPSDGQVCSDVDGDENDYALCRYDAVYCSPQIVGGYAKECDCFYDEMVNGYVYRCDEIGVLCGDDDDEDEDEDEEDYYDDSMDDEGDFISDDDCDPMDFVEPDQENVHVCGSNGIVYANVGALNCANYQETLFRDELITIADKGVCLPPASPAATACDESNCAHSDLWAPVCGSNGATYRNEGVLACANFCSEDTTLDSHIKLQDYGPCPKSATVALEEDVVVTNVECDPSDCMYTTEMAPVCGSDGVTYSNAGALNCQNYCTTTTDPPTMMIHIASMGTCGTAKPLTFADPNNDVVCPKLPKTGDSCTYSTNDQDCLYDPLVCRQSDGSTNSMAVFGYLRLCSCRDDDDTADDTTKYTCMNVPLECPDYNNNNDNNNKADPENDPSCPANAPASSGTIKCHEVDEDKACFYNPVYCDGDPDDGDNIFGYTQLCRCDTPPPIGIGTTTITDLTAALSNELFYQCEEKVVTCPNDDADDEEEGDTENDDDCDCVSTEEYAPVCGSDGTTYDNTSKLHCKNYCRDTTNEDMILVAGKGPCTNNDPVQNEEGVDDDDEDDDDDCNIANCMHSEEYVPVCGTDGMTYENTGALECANYCRTTSSTTEPLVELANTGPCKTPIVQQDDDDDCDCVSTEEYNPVCGTDGVTYDNISKLHCANYCRGPNAASIREQGKGPCGSNNNGGGGGTITIDYDDDCDCVSTEEYAPVCGTNDVTYDNISKLHCANYCKGPNADSIREQDKGPCGSNNNNGGGGNDDVCDCVSTEEYGPVCGTDGVTYDNISKLHCANYCRGPDVESIRQQGKGSCGSNSGTITIDYDDDCDCVETEEYVPVCGTDGITYDNMSKLHCTNYCKEEGVKTIRLENKGPCGNTNNEEDDEDEDCDVADCMHTEEYNPVCGTNGVTYENIGALGCANYCIRDVNHPVVQFASVGSCKQGQNQDQQQEEVACDCVTTAEVAPVCGTNGITYVNAAALNCHNYCNTDATIPDVQIIHKGECTTTGSTVGITGDGNTEMGPSTNHEADPLNNVACPATLPQIGSVCGGSMDEENLECQYQPKYCSDGNIYGYQKDCNCMESMGIGTNTEGNMGTMQCTDVVITCPDTPGKDFAVPSPAPVSTPPVVVPLYPAAALSTKCPRTKPQDGTKCDASSTMNKSCRYTPYSCEDSMDIAFRDVCSCDAADADGGGQFRCNQNVNLPECHNNSPLVSNDQKCPFLAPLDQDLYCNLPPEKNCGYDPAGCPGSNDPGIFLTTCTCVNEEFMCLAQAQEDVMSCDYDDEEEDLNTTNMNNDESSANMMMKMTTTTTTILLVVVAVASMIGL